MIETGTLLQERFLIEEQIGVGGMGAVYRAVDQKFGTDVAIKETFYNDPALAEAFEREARLLNGLHHPLFPHVSDHFVEGNGHFLVMEYIEGEDISELLKRGERFDVDTVLRWTLDLLDGLDYLHSQDPAIIHRDVKPSNLKLTPRGNIILLDFGMAKESSDSTQEMNSVFGYSRRYSPLEQIEGTGTDERSDIFSLGATVYHLLTGQPPVDVLARASAIVAGKADPLRLATEIDPDVPELIAAMINTALALNPEKRFISARAMWNALEEVSKADEAVVASAPAISTTVSAEVNFPALEAFENDADLSPGSAPAIFRAAVGDDPDPLEHEAAKRFAELRSPDTSGTDFFHKETNRFEIPISGDPNADDNTEDLGKVDRPRDEISERPIAPVVAYGPATRTNWNARLLWLPTVVLLLGLIAFGLYRSSSHDSNGADAASEETAPAEQAPPAVTDPQTESFVQDAKESPDTENQQPLVNEKNESAASLPERSRSEEKLHFPGILQNEDRSPAKKVAGSDSPSLASKNLNTRRGVRPRIVDSRDAQPPVSSIESIITGVPDRQVQQRELEIWQQEELRRQRRVRRMMRQNRRYPPY